MSICILKANAQDGDSTQNNYKRVYYENNYEFLFQFGFIETEQPQPVTLRFSGFYHTEELMHIDFGTRFGMYSGVGIRNVGLVETNNNTDYKIKRRTYMLGVPLALKIGGMKSKKYLILGGEMELAFHYKQKLFIPGYKKEVEKEWFSNRINMWHPSIFAGIKFKERVSFRAKYYFQNFLNQEFQGIDFKRIENYQQIAYDRYVKSNIFYLSLVFHLSDEGVFDKESGSKKGVQYTSF